MITTNTKKSFLTWNIMLLLILLTVGVFPVSGQQQGSHALLTENFQEIKSFYDIPVSIEVEKAPLDEIFSQLEKQIGLRFLYDSKMIRKSEYQLDLSFTDGSVADVLKEVALKTGLTFRQVNGTISVGVDKLREPVTERIAVVQQTITGTVLDAQTGEVLPGVNVVAQGTGGTNSAPIGTATNIDGYYEFEVPDDISTLVFSYVGYWRLEVSIDGRTEINVELSQDIQMLEDVVVVGYGTQEKSDITGSVSSISEKALQEVPVTSPSQMLQGRAAGVDVVSAGNKPGDGVSIRIRGTRSFSAGNDPLFVVDGIPVSDVSLNDINPYDIESIEILKDASATAIYGSRGANGVVIITTKRGGSGRVNVSYNSYLGIRKIMRYPDLMTGAEFAEMRREAFRTIGQYDDNNPNADEDIFQPIELESLGQQNYTDWYRLFIKEGLTQNQNLSVSGGSENTRFNISLGYFDDIGIIPNQRFSRYNARINLDQSIGDRFDIGISTIGTFSQENGTDINPLGGTGDYGAYSENPLGPPFDEDGNLILHQSPGEGNRTNPVADINTDQVVNRQKIFRLLSSIYAEYEILDGLGIRMNFGPDISQYKKGDFRGSLTRENAGGPATAAVIDEFDFSYTWENIINYNATFAQSHRLGFTGLYSIQSQQLEGYGSDVIGLPLDSFEYYNMGAASTLNTISSSFEKSTIKSYMARFNYVYDDRYLVTLTGRADGSSKFAEGNKWGYFPSFALGWNITNESFFEPNDIISYLKLRLSYGKTGNQGINPYQTRGLLERTAYLYDGSAFGFSPFSIANDDLKWETTSSFNVGLDFDLMSSRITGSIEVYQSNTTDLLLPRLLPISSGFNSILTNVGATRNTGIEFSISTFNITPSSTGGFSWNTDLNLFHNKEEIVELSQGKVDDVGNQRFIGQPINVFYDYEKIGIWQLGQDQLAEQYSSIVGGIKVRDVNENGSIDPNDRKILGSNVPDLSGGLTNRFGYKGFDLAIITYFRLGQMVRGQQYGSGRFLSGRGNHVNVDYWTPDNPTNAFPVPNASLSGGPFFGSTLSYFDGSFFKVRNITLGYNISSNLAQKLSLQSLRLYVSVQNPLFISPYISKHNGVDPENPTTSAPVSRTFLTGININF